MVLRKAAKKKVTSINFHLCNIQSCNRSNEQESHVNEQREGGGKEVERGREGKIRCGVRQVR